MDAQRTPLVLVTGLSRSHVARAADDLLAAGTAVVRYDVRELGAGVVVRTVREPGAGGVVEQRTAVELAHGCLTCTLRLDLLPLLRHLARRVEITRIVLELDPALEPEHLCWALRSVVLDENPSAPPETAADWVTVGAVLAVVDTTSWLSDATGDDELHERGLAALPDDDRTVAQVLVDHTAFADALLLAGEPAGAWEAARLTAVLDRLVPGAPRAPLAPGRAEQVLTGIGPEARRGRPTSPHDPMLAGQPPLTDDCGVRLVHFSASRPFFPERLHDALDVLLDGVVRTRGRIWLASQHDRVVWLESAGQAARIGDGGPWLAALPDDPDDWADIDPERRAATSLRWDDVHGDRDVEIVVLTHQRSAAEITAVLGAALLTDEEWAAGPGAWAGYPDPFGSWHEDPCEASGPVDIDLSSPTGEEGNR